MENVADDKKKKAYTLRTYGLRNKSLKVFEKKYEELRKYALRKGEKEPVKGELASQLFDLVDQITPEQFFIHR